MEHWFETEEWKELAPAQRAQRCRFMSREAETLAKGAPRDVALSYMKIAEEWIKLAEEIERSRI